MKEVLCIVLDMVTGNVASALATIGIAIVGVAALMGKASWGLALTVGVGIGVMFGAVGIVDTLGLGYADCS
jgi:type IV secretion system protein VirB2